MLKSPSSRRMIDSDNDAVSPEPLRGTGKSHARFQDRRQADGVQSASVAVLSEGNHIIPPYRASWRRPRESMRPKERRGFAAFGRGALITANWISARHVLVRPLSARGHRGGGVDLPPRTSGWAVPN